MEKRKKILFVITKSNWGGAQKYVFDLATNLPKEKFIVSVALGGDGELKKKLESASVSVINITGLERDVSLRKDLYSFVSLYKIIKKEKPDIVHINSSKAGGIGTLVSRICGVKKIIFTAHAWAFNEDRNLFSKKLIKLLHYLTVLWSHKTITVSNAVKEQMSGTHFVKNKMVVVHLGVKEPEFIEKLEARKMLGIPDNSFSIGTNAELHPIKGLIYGLKAMEDKTFGTYTIIGMGQEKDFLQNTINSNNNLKNSVKLVGFIPEAARYMKAFDIFLLPSLSEAFGYVLLEAGLAKLPVIASNVGGIPEIISNEKDGTLIPPKNSASIISALEKYKSNDSLRKIHGETLYKKIKNEFSLERMVKRTIEIYES